MSRLKTLLVGFGKVAASYAQDERMAEYFPFATHAQVLKAHQAFDWDAVVDENPESRFLAKEQWGVNRIFPSLSEIPADYQADVAVIATPPAVREQVVDSVPGLRAVLVEKPLGPSLECAESFLTKCRQRKILVQVNFWRRADEQFRRFSQGFLAESIGAVQNVSVTYGNGLLNNGSHMLDLFRMLIGEIKVVRLLRVRNTLRPLPIDGDLNIDFFVESESGVTGFFSSIDFAHYRENFMQIWGERGVLSIDQEGLGISCAPLAENRAMSGEMEVAFDRRQSITSTVGQAFYEMYSNLAAATDGTAQLWSSGESALATSQIVDALLKQGREMHWCSNAAKL
jgi:predicted dehydrogenase